MRTHLPNVLVGLWSGQPFQYQGEYYYLEEVVFLPRPVRSPRIPIWVGGSYPRRGPMQRAARWDGTCISPISADGRWTPADVQALKAFIEGERPSSTPFDIVLGGQQRSADWEQERALIKSLAEVGATWWIEWIPPASLDVMRACVQRVPYASTSRGLISAAERRGVHHRVQLMLQRTQLLLHVLIFSERLAKPGRLWYILFQESKC